MGLAICIVSTEKEKVWYHTCANRGRGCSNTNLVDQRGCCIWYDEPAYLAAIEQRVGASIPEMNAVDFSVKGKSVFDLNSHLYIISRSFSCSEICLVIFRYN